MKLLGHGWLRIAGILRLSFAHHVNQLDWIRRKRFVSEFQLMLPGFKDGGWRVQG
jgi:hypothetical protein